MNRYQAFHTQPDYINPQVMSINRLPAHTRFGAYSSAALSLRQEATSSALRTDILSHFAGTESSFCRRDETVLHLDAAHAPIGDDMAWSTAADYRDMSKPGCYYLQFMMQ